jgi:hypothetical protein
MSVVTVNINDAPSTASGISLPAAVVVGLNEEITKALPVLHWFSGLPSRGSKLVRITPPRHDVDY